MKTKNLKIALILILLMSQSFLLIVVEAQDIENKIKVYLEGEGKEYVKEFTDPKLKKAVITRIAKKVTEDHQTDFEESKMAEYVNETFTSIDQMHIAYQDIEDLAGLGKFTNLEKLEFSGNKVKGEIDLSGFKQLVELCCNDNNKLEGIILPDSLESLSCYKNKLTGLNLSKLAKLRELNCGRNQIKTLDLSGNWQLEVLECQSNELKDLTLDQNPKLKKLNCRLTKLKALDVSKNPELEELTCDNNEIAELKLEANTRLKKLYCKNNKLTELDLSNNSNIETLGCGWNMITSLVLSNLSQLKHLWCRDNKIEELDLSSIKYLEQLEVSNNRLTVIDPPEGKVFYTYVDSFKGKPENCKGKWGTKGCGHINNEYPLTDGNFRYVKQGVDLASLGLAGKEGRISGLKGGKIEDGKFYFDERSSEITYVYDTKVKRWYVNGLTPDKDIYEKVDVKPTITLKLLSEYRVEHYFETGFETGQYKLTNSEIMFGIAGQYTDVMASNYQGYEIAGSVQQVMIKSDNSSVIKIYYKKLPDPEPTTVPIYLPTDPIPTDDPAPTDDPVMPGASLTVKPLPAVGEADLSPMGYLLLVVVLGLLFLSRKDLKD